MNGLIKYLLGIITGVVITAIFFTFTGDLTITVTQNRTEQTEDSVSETAVEPENQATSETVGETSKPKTKQLKKKVKPEDIIEIGIPGNYIQLYRGMSKDEVLEILGKPKNTSIHSSFGDVSETWNYGEYFKGILFLKIEFENGKLLNINQL